MLRRLALIPLLTVLAAGCGSSDRQEGRTQARRVSPALGGRPVEEPVKAEQPDAAASLGFPGFATKNTTRVGGADPVANAAGVAQAVFPSRSPETRPAAVSLVDAGDWRVAISAAQLMSRPLRVPVLFSQGGRVPAATASALSALQPTGAEMAGGARLLRIGDAPGVQGLEDRVLTGDGFAGQARAIDQLHIRAAGKPATAVLVASADQPALAMPAAGWAAKSGTPVLWVQGATVPPATRDSIRDHGRPRIYLLGPASAIPESVATELRRLGRVERIAGRDPVTTAVAFARYSDSGFGWNAVDPGHGYVFASAARPADAAAAAPLSASGTYGPLLLVTQPGQLDKPVEEYLLDVQPGYDSDPVRGVYNHGWLMGDEGAVTVDVQSRIDALLEIQPVDRTN